ncbi:DUF4189 domain-containing protein [Aequorivita sp. Q41]|uniref:DUF4189 domain-containing protein n=1 Tax=Aequorivita sp. Q41 TaxID=3153300 RepID=UPI003242B81B
MNKLFSIAFLFLSTLIINAQDTGNYASLAIDARNGEAYGWAVNYETQAEANERALKECEEAGANCHLVLKFEGGCGAYVVERGNPSLYGWGVANSRAEAEAIAKEEASAQGGTDLVVRVWGCNSDTLITSEIINPTVKGVYGFYFLKSDEYKKGFLSEMFYEPGVVQNASGTWQWTSDAERKMSPRAQQFVDAMEENLYGYLDKATRDKMLTRLPLDWEGVSEIKPLKDKVAIESTVERKAFMERVFNGVRNSVEKDGYEVVEISF